MTPFANETKAFADRVSHYFIALIFELCATGIYGAKKAAAEASAVNDSDRRSQDVLFRRSMH